MWTWFIGSPPFSWPDYWCMVMQIWAEAAGLAWCSKHWYSLCLRSEMQACKMTKSICLGLSEGALQIQRISWPLGITDKPWGLCLPRCDVGCRGRNVMAGRSQIFRLKHKVWAYVSPTLGVQIKGMPYFCSCFTLKWRIHWKKIQSWVKILFFIYF